MNQEIIRIDLEGVNCYLLKENDKFILFDTGGHLFMDKIFTNRREKLEKELEMNGCYPDNLILIVLTHGDNDHSANAAFLRNKYKARIAMHSGDVKLVEAPSLEEMLENSNYNSIIYKIIFQLMKKQLKKISQKTLNDFEKFKPDIIIDEGDSLLKYGFHCKIIHLPGHTYGSIGILTEDNSLIVGDTYANLKKPTAALNALDFSILSKSIDRLKAMDIKMVYPGHGAPFESGSIFNKSK
ncbi:MBL fold metallo-hydrolase [Clostridium neuense]|uniref:MBL fold metallo-hydrolase n=1 Tax=Clostridium neuense TaxID=1728934 RepID=A0ABW8TFW4_9CLOT